MGVSLRRSFGLTVVLGTCVGLTANYVGKTSEEQKTDRAQMTVVPVGVSGAFTHGKGTGRHGILSGIASWYGDVFDGRRTANGEIFDQEAMTACHRTLPFGTLVRVINLRNRHSVIVRINDRGVLTPERVIDLSSAAAAKLGMLNQGTAPVRLEIVAAAAMAPLGHQPG